MRATLTFELPEEQEEFLQAVHASDYLMVIHEIRNRIRSHFKYGEELTMEDLQEEIFAGMEGLPW